MDDDVTSDFDAPPFVGWRLWALAAIEAVGMLSFHLGLRMFLS